MAAAFAALVSLNNNLELIQNHPTHSFNFEPKQILSLKEAVTSLIHFLKRTDYSPGIRKEAAEALERRIARAAEAAEDVVESHVVDQIRSGETRLSNTRSSRFLLDLQKVTLDLDYMRRKAINVKVRSGAAAGQQPTYSVAVVTSSTSNNPSTTMVGFDHVLHQLLDQLTGCHGRVIPIVGMGGIGKTFLATKAFQHPTVVHRFDILLWATISQQYMVEKVLYELVSGLRKLNSNTSDESTSYRIVDEGLEEELYKGLCGRRYLIILDDMWSVEAWYEIRSLFPDNDSGSRIVVTTRHSNVASHLSIPWLAIRLLNADYSWDLFYQKAFAEKGCPPELEEIGKKIVEKCNGLPLAIVVAGGHLKNSTMSLQYWENVANHMDSILDSTENDEHCLNILSSSYSYLPPHLKPCFLLLGAFPEDERIYGRDIRKLWITEGLIQHVENTLLETVAEDYLWDLYQRNLILVDALDYNGKIVFFKLHDLLRELCIKIGKKEEFSFVLDSPRAIHRERRVVIYGEVAKGNNQIETFNAPIRCLMYQGGWPSYNFKLLRTLHKVFSESTSISVFQQVNLRFLKVNLEGTTLRTFYLPSSISLLWNLQILAIDLIASWSKVIAPYEIWEMLQLRHLDITSLSLLDPLPVDDKANDLVLRNLQTLWKAENFRLSEEVCNRIPNLKELHLLYYGEASLYYCPQNLCRFELDFFLCDFDRNSTWRDFAMSLTFPTSLKWLFLSGCRVDWEEMTAMVGSLPHLISLRLLRDAVIGSVWTTVEEKFPSLKNLEIWECNELVYLNVESSHFPVLQTLNLRNLSNLDELISDIGEIPTLQRISMTYCSKSSSFSAVRTLLEQEEQGNEDFQVHISLRGDEETLRSFKNKVLEEGLTSNNLFLDLQIVKPKNF